MYRASPRTVIPLRSRACRSFAPKPTDSLSSCRRGPPPRRDFAIIWPVGYLNAHTRATGPAGIRRQYARAALTGLELAAGLGEALGVQGREQPVSPYHTP